MVTDAHSDAIAIAESDVETAKSVVKSVTAACETKKTARDDCALRYCSQGNRAWRRTVSYAVERPQSPERRLIGAIANCWMAGNACGR